MIKREPGPGHQALLRDLHGVCDKYEAQGIPAIEQIMMMAQLIGQKIDGLSPLEFEAVSVLQTVNANIVTGNQHAGGDRIISGVVGHG